VTLLPSIIDCTWPAGGPGKEERKEKRKKKGKKRKKARRRGTLLAICLQCIRNLGREEAFCSSRALSRKKTKGRKEKKKKRRKKEKDNIESPLPSSVLFSLRFPAPIIAARDRRGKELSQKKRKKRGRRQKNEGRMGGLDFGCYHFSFCRTRGDYAALDGPSTRGGKRKKKEGTTRKHKRELFPFRPFSSGCS